MSHFCWIFSTNVHLFGRALTLLWTTAAAEVAGWIGGVAVAVEAGWTEVAVGGAAAATRTVTRPVLAIGGRLAAATATRTRAAAKVASSWCIRSGAVSVWVLLYCFWSSSWYENFALILTIPFHDCCVSSADLDQEKQDSRQFCGLSQSACLHAGAWRNMNVNMTSL